MLLCPMKIFSHNNKRTIPPSGLHYDPHPNLHEALFVQFQVTSFISFIDLDTSEKLVWFPRNLNEVSTCSKALYKYGSELSEDHPVRGDG